MTSHYADSARSSRAPTHGRARARRELRDGRRGPRPFGRAFDAAVDARAHEADEFYAPVIPSERSEEERRVMRQAKSGERYALTPDTATFLDRRSPAYLGDAASFIASPHLYEGFRDVAAAVRNDGTAMAAGGTVAPDHPVWDDFARVMRPSARPAADAMAAAMAVDGTRTVRVLDVAAGHGAFGIALATRHANVEVTALDWPRVLDVARSNAEQAGLGERYRTIAGNAFDVDWGTGYDLVLLANFLHHWSVGDCERLARTARAALAAGGRAVTVEFVPNDDRVTPPAAASFALVMLCTTADGDAYTFAEYDRIFRAAGFARSELHPLPPTTQQLIVSST